MHLGALGREHQHIGLCAVVDDAQGQRVLAVAALDLAGERLAVADAAHHQIANIGIAAELVGLVADDDLANARLGIEVSHLASHILVLAFSAQNHGGVFSPTCT